MKVILPITILIAALFLGVFVYSSTQKSSDATAVQQESSTGQKADDAMKAGDKKEKARYFEYSKALLGSAKGTRRVLFFYANWCPTCRPADESFSQNERRIPEDVTLIRVNYNDTETDQEEKDLSTKYGVTYQHTFVQIDSEGNALTKWNGGQINELLQNIK